MSFLPMAKTILKSLVGHPATQMYPLVKKEYYQGTRGHIANNLEVCIYCGICQKKCPTGAIAVNRTEKTWSIEPLSCITCSYCADNCPKKCLTMENRYSEAVTAKQ